MAEVDSERRKTLYLAVFGAAALPLLESQGHASEQTRRPGGTFPERFWAHRDGRVKLHAHGAIKSTDDLLDYALIQESFARYGMAFDEYRMDVLSALFTADAVVELGHGSGKAFATLTGHDSVISNFDKALSHQTDQRRHFFTNIVLDKLTRTEATALAYEVITVAADGLNLGASVFCVASLRKSPGGLWQFSRMFIGMDDYI